MFVAGGTHSINANSERLPRSTRPFCNKLILVFVFLLAATACNRHKAREGRGLLPSPSGQELASGVEPAQPFNEKVGEHAFARTRFLAGGPSNTEIRIRDVIVGSRAEGHLDAIQGATLVDLNSGSGSAVAGGKSLDLSFLRPVALPAGAAITLRNSGDAPLSVRLYIVEGK